MKEISTLGVKKRGGIHISYMSFYAISLVYLVLPIVILFFGWLRPVIAIPASILLIGALVWSVRDCTKDCKTTQISNGLSIDVSIKYIVILAIAVFLLTIISDVGEYVWGTYDHAFRRAIYRDMVNKSWPIVYDLKEQTNPVINAILPDEVVGFSYYFAFWTVSAIIGKLFGFAIGNFCVVLWAVIGIFLTMIGMVFVINKASYAIIYAYIFFSGLDILPYFYFQTNGTQEWMWLEGYTRHIVYISNINNLFNVFNQCIPCWLIVVLLMLTKNNRSIGLIGALTFAYSPWATIGMVPLAIYFLVRKEVMDKEKKINIKNILHPLNIVPAVLMLAIFAPMYMANSNATSVSGPTIRFYGSIGAFAGGYIFAVLVELVPIAILLWKDYKRNPLFWVTMGTLLVMPFYKISGQNDFTMRGSMPEFFVFTIMLASVIARVIAENKNNNNAKEKTTIQSLKFVGAVVILIAMSFVAFQMLLITIVSTFDGSSRFTESIYSLGDVRDPEFIDLIDEQFYVYDYENTFFFKHMARRT